MAHDEHTHYVRWDQPLFRKAKVLRAVCGIEAPRATWSPTPTCPSCAEWVQEYDRVAVRGAWQMDRKRDHEGRLEK